MIKTTFARRSLAGHGAVLGLLAAMTGSATAATAQDSANAECELHMWSSEDFGSLPFGDGLAPALAAMFPGDLSKSVDDQFKSLATANVQLDAVKRADPVSMFALPAGTRIITHNDTEDQKVTRSRKGRRSDSAASCYYELHVVSHYLIEDIVWGDRFTTDFEFRSYSTNAQWDFRHQGEGGNKLTVFPVKPTDDPAQAITKVAEAIKANFGEYAPKVARAKARRKR
ncbi:MAG: hypothetical protein ACKO01_03635 [Erythrobacter sp.]